MCVCVVLLFVFKNVITVYNTFETITLPFEMLIYTLWLQSKFGDYRLLSGFLDFCVIYLKKKVVVAYNQEINSNVRFIVTI